MFNKYFGVELNVSYLTGGTNQTSLEQISSSGSSINKTRFSSKMIRFLPSFVLSAGFKKINPYFKFGILFGSGTTKTSSTHTNFITTWEYDQNFAIGITSSLGVLIPIKDNMSFFSEINIVNLSTTHSKGTQIEYMVNGIDGLPTIQIRDKQTVYKDQLDYNPTLPVDKSIPREEIKTQSPFNSIGLNLGLRIGF
jgi:Outer membrane protein beta-barrel domain